VIYYFQLYTLNCLLTYKTRQARNMTHHDIIVIGTSAGGIQALSRLLVPLKSTIPASLFVVQHLSPASSAEALVSILQKYTELSCEVAQNGLRIKHGHIYVAPVDHHLLVKGDKILLNRGARENGFRPAIDTTFRSAAAHYGARVAALPWYKIRKRPNLQKCPVT
jgi:two-component system, chemotaxis family, protein-glutamate methylesterase/glutaminase